MENITSEKASSTSSLRSCRKAGPLAADESFGNVNFNCKDTVLSNGKNITVFGTSTTINFADPAAFDFNGSNLASGVYFYRLETDNFVQTKRMVLLK